MDESGEMRVVYYPGCFNNYWAPQNGKAVVRILERNGFRVTVPKHRCCGIARMAYGDTDGARKAAARLVDELFVLAEQDLDIVTDCPSCALALKEEYPFLLNSEKAGRVSEQTHFFSRFLNDLHQTGKLDTGFGELSLTVAYHSPCHLRAQGLGDDSIKLMALIPGLQVTDLSRGCCGMAGTAGFRHRYYESAMGIGEALSERVEEVDAQILTTDCGGCKLQMEQMSDGEVLHPVVLIDKAYRTQ